MHEMSDDYSTARWNGEIDSLESPPEGALWQKISCNRFTCMQRIVNFTMTAPSLKHEKRFPRLMLLLPITTLFWQIFLVVTQYFPL
jgi:ATP-dependent DNA helicase DinG